MVSHIPGVDVGWMARVPGCEDIEEMAAALPRLRELAKRAVARRRAGYGDLDELARKLAAEASAETD